MTATPSEPLTVATGALDDGRRRKWHLLVAAAGWVIVGLLVGWLASHAGEVELRMTLFLVCVVVVVAVMGTSLAVDVLRPPLIRARAVDRPKPLAEGPVDALGRPIAGSGAAELTGEFTLDESSGVRRYVEVDAR
jgi:hypothetical protein